MNFKIKVGYFLPIVLFISYGCNNKQTTSVSKNKNRYKFHKEIFRYDLGQKAYKDIHAYVNEKDTFAFNEVVFKNNVIDTFNSLFYEFELKKIENRYTGNLIFYYDSIRDGKLDLLNLSLLSTTNGKTKRIEFESENNNILELDFKHDTDTIMGVLYTRHFKDTIENGVEKTRMRTRFYPVDNYDETSNPFIGIKP